VSASNTFLLSCFHTSNCRVKAKLAALDNIVSTLDYSHLSQRDHAVYDGTSQTRVYSESVGSHSPSVAGIDTYLDTPASDYSEDNRYARSGVSASGMDRWATLDPGYAASSTSRHSQSFTRSHSADRRKGNAARLAPSYSRSLTSPVSRWCIATGPLQKVPRVLKLRFCYNSYTISGV
jgi:hypothetical protein